MPLPILFAAALAAQVPLPPPAQSGPTAVQVIVDLQPADAVCDGVTVSAAALAVPIPVAATVNSDQTIAPFVFTFRIDASGRPLGIAAAPRPTSSVYLIPSDLQSALAASRFAPGTARDRCTISYTATSTAIADAPLHLVYRYLALPHDRNYLDTAIARRARDASPGCFSGKAPTVLLRAYPDFDAIPQPSGTLSMTIVSFDIDAAGKPVHVRTAAGDRNAALDAAARDAVAKSRFARERRTGCTYPYHRRQSTPLAAPPSPPVADFRKPDDTCGEDRAAWRLPPRLTFPEAFRRRAIEGWAVIGYDVAPWGQTGNVTVLASEPAAMFGEQARQIIQAAKRPASATGASGCIERVLFKLPQNPPSESASPSLSVDG